MITEQTLDRETHPVRTAKLPIFRKRRFLIAGVAILLAMGYLLYNAFLSGSAYFLTVGEFKAQAATMASERVRLGGQVVPGSVNWDSKSLTIKFNIRDEATDDTLPVVYKGVVPDTFQPGNEVVVEGRLAASGEFQADTLLAKCPSKYEPKKS